MKEFIKGLLKKLPFALTRNQQYDRDTQHIIRRICKPDSHCIDVGCHKGEILDLFIAAAPKGRYYAFEPIPAMFADLQRKYAQNANVQVYDCALSDAQGEAEFNHVLTNPAYSGLQKRQYDRKDEQDQRIKVRTERLDDILPAGSPKIDLIKIDVEGGELQVLKGATALLQRDKPVLIFEHGLGASDVYGTTPNDIFDLLTACGLRLFNLSEFLRPSPQPLSREALHKQFYGREHYYFVASA